MEYKIIPSKKYLEDIGETLRYYALIDVKLKTNFSENLYRCHDLILEYPLMYSLRYKNVRRANLKTFPFCIFFVVQGKEIILNRLMHQHRDSYLWP